MSENSVIGGRHPEPAEKVRFSLLVRSCRGHADDKLSRHFAAGGCPRDLVLRICRSGIGGS